MKASTRKFLRFGILCYGITWCFWLLLAASKRGLIVELPTLLLNLLGGSGPAVAAIAVSARVEGLAGVRYLLGRLLRWRLPPHLYIAALLLPPVLLTCVALMLAVLFEDTSGWTIGPLGAAVTGFLLRLVILPLEEVGWRGFALPLLQRDHSSLAAAVIVGVAWSPWHLPLFLIPGERAGEGRLLEIAIFLIFVPVLSILFTWLFNRSQGSLLPPVILHASYNTTVAAAIPPEELGTAFRITGLVVITALCAFLVWRYGPDRLGRTSIDAVQSSPGTN